jgi:3-oxo-5alpha-steroid 4-dehydrogenase
MTQEAHVEVGTVFPLPEAEVAEWASEVDVVVAGGGCAGVSAALESSRASADTMLLESASGLGGASAMAGGEIYLGGGTPVQTACGYRDSPEEMMKFLMAALGPYADPSRIGVYCEHSVEHFHWLVEQGVPFKPTMYEKPIWLPPTDDGLMWLGENTFPFNELAIPAPRGHRPQHGGHGGWLLMNRLQARLAETKVDVRADVTVERLVAGSDNAVVGVIGRHFGERIAIRARRGVVLCLGGFVYNDDMLQLHAPNLIGHRKIGTDGDDGRGILMGQAVGGQVKQMSSVQAALTMPMQLLIRGILVNRFGQRFINEDTYGGLQGLAAITGRHTPVYLIIDEASYDEVPEGERLGRRPKVVADSVAELEHEIGLPDGALQSTVALFNQYAARGDDQQFHKQPIYLRPLTPPFGVIDVCSNERLPDGDSGAMITNTGFGVFTTGGLATTTDGEVLDLNGAAIDGLYAAGRTAAGIQAGGGYISGTSLGDGTYFGRRAGLAAAAHTARSAGQSLGR